MAWTVIFTAGMCLIIVGHYTLRPLIKNYLDKYSWRSRVDRSIANFEAFMKETRDDIKEIRETIERIYPLLPEPNPPASKGSSKLNPLGEENSKELAATEWPDSFPYQNKPEGEGRTIEN